MLKTFKAILKNDSIQWVDENTILNLDKSIKVQITFLEEIATNQTKSNGKKMAEALRKISNNHTFAKVEPQKWQQQVRQDRFLPNRD